MSKKSPPTRHSRPKRSAPRSPALRSQPLLRLSTEEFHAGLARAASWATLHASEEDLAELAGLIEDQDFQRELAVLGPIVQRHRDELARHGEALCAQMDWHTRAIIIEGSLALTRAQSQFLPERGMLLTEQARRELFAIWLTVLSRRHGEDPTRALRVANTYEVLVPYALRRLVVEADKQLGFLYGVIPLMQAAADAQEPGAAALLDQTLQALVKLSWKHLPPSLLKLDPKEVSGYVASALGHMLVGRMRPPSGQALEAVIAGLEEKLNILPKAVANVTSKDARRDGLYRNITVDLRLAERASDDDPLTDLLQNEQDKTVQEILDWIYADPKRTLGYRALVKEQPQAALAKEARKTKATIGNYLKALKRDLKEFKARLD